MICEKCEDLKNKLLKKPGDIITIYLGELPEGNAVLVEPRPSWSDTVPFPIQDVDDEACEQVNVISRSWVVDFIGDKFTRKFRTVRKVLEFHSCGEIEKQDDEELLEDQKQDCEN